MIRFLLATLFAALALIRPAVAQPATAAMSYIELSPLNGGGHPPPMVTISTAPVGREGASGTVVVPEPLYRSIAKEVEQVPCEDADVIDPGGMRVAVYGDGGIFLVCSLTPRDAYRLVDALAARLAPLGIGSGGLREWKTFLTDLYHGRFPDRGMPYIQLSFWGNSDRSPPDLRISALRGGPSNGSFLYWDAVPTRLFARIRADLPRLRCIRAPDMHGAAIVVRQIDVRGETSRCALRPAETRTLIALLGHDYAVFRLEPGAFDEWRRRFEPSIPRARR